MTSYIWYDLWYHKFYYDIMVHIISMISTSDWFPTMIFRGCCEVSTPETKKENLVETALDYRPWPPPIHSATFYISYSKSKVNQKESSPQPMDRWKKLNFDGVYPLVNRAHVILLASGGPPRQSTRVMEHGCQLLTKKKWIWSVYTHNVCTEDVQTEGLSDMSHFHSSGTQQICMR